MRKDITIFISYAHEDGRLCKELDKQLSWLKRSKGIKVWDDRSIHIGAERQQEINLYLNTAQIILLLISPDFMASERCYTEMKRAMERHEAGETHVIPVILRPVDWADAPFAKLQILPTDAQPVTSKRGYKRDDAFFNIAQGIRSVIEGRRLQWRDSISLSDGHRHNLSEAPEVINFHGRKNEFDELKRWIVDDHCRLVAMLGIGGIGKTSLALQLAEEIKNEFEYVFWRSLEHKPPLKRLLQDCIQFVSNEREIELPEDIEDQIGLLIQYLQDHRCLFILDNFESVMRGNHSAPGYEEYERLLKRAAQARESQSCFLLTSREKPKELAYLAGQTRPVRTLTLPGLSTGEGREILKDNSLFGSDDLLMDDLVHLSSGNPLILKVVANYIHEFLGDDIVGFLQEGRAVMGKIEDVLEQQFLRLSVSEEEAIYWLAIEREAVSLSDLRENLLTDVSKKTLPDALLSLQQRSLIETRGTVTFTLQPVIMEYVTERFVQRVCQEFEAETPGIWGSHALMKAQSQDYVRESQVRFILNPIVQRLHNSLGKVGFEEKCKQMLSQLRATHSQGAAYAAGNILHMLIQSEYGLNAYDFSHLPLRQVYLQGISLHDVNFAYADFVKPLFTDTFGSILSVAFSPDGNQLAAGTATGEIRLWDTANGALTHTLRSNPDWIRSVAFSPDGTIVASGSEDYMVRLWDLSTGLCRNILQGHTSTAFSIAFSTDGKLLFSGGHDGFIKRWDVVTGQILSTLSDQPEQDLFWSVALSPDGKLVASGNENHMVQIWEVSTGQLLNTLEGHTDSVFSVAFSPNGKLLASGSEDTMVHLWEVSTGKLLKILKGHTDWVWPVVFTADGKALASSGDDYTIRLWDISSSQCFKTLQGHTNTVWSLSFHPNGHILASGSADQTVRLWDMREGVCLKVLQGYINGIHSIAFSPDGKTIASGSEDKVLRLWDVKTGQCRQMLPSHKDIIWSVAFSPDGRQLVSGSTEALHVWSTHDDQYQALSGHTSWVYCAIFSPDGKTIASGSDDGTVRLWDVGSGNCHILVEHPVEMVRCVVFSSDGKKLVIGSGTVHLWNLESGEPSLNITDTVGIYSVAFSPNGDMIVGGGETRESGTNAVYLWDANTGQRLKTLSGHIGVIRSVAFSPDGKTIASGSDDHTIRLWDVNKELCTRILQGHTDQVSTVVFSPNGKAIASGSQDGTIKRWSVRTGRCLDTLRSDRPYERMNITGVKGITEAQKSMLKTLGAIEHERDSR